MKRIILAAIISAVFIPAFAGDTQRTNLALHCAVFPSSGEGAEYAVDGVRKGSFHSSMISPKHFLEVDLGEVRHVDGIKVFFYWGDSRIYTFYVTGSADGKKWEMLADFRKHDIVSSANGYGKDFPARKLRFVKVHVTGNTVNKASHIREIEIYGK